MRADHDAPVQSHLKTNRTITIIKPQSDPRTRMVLEEALGRDAIVAERVHTMTEEDVAFLYTTAYGMEFIRDLIRYMTSAESKLLLIEMPGINNMQDALKRFVRRQLLSFGLLRNNIHFPDSISESLAQIEYFFPEAV